MATRLTPLSPPALSAAIAFALIAAIGLPVQGAAQTHPTTGVVVPGLPIHHSDPTYGAWHDQSGDLPGTEISTTLLVAVGVVVVAAVAYYVFRSDDGDAAEGNGEKDDSAMAPIEPDARIPTLFVDVDDHAPRQSSAPRWSFGVAWRF